jgi:hypothetical protein
MARSYGANATLAGKLEATYGTAPSGDYESLPFVSSSLGSEQGLIESDVLGQGRDPVQPIRDVIRVEGDVVVPVDLRSFGFWLELLLGPPTTTGAEDPYTHTFHSGEDDLPSASLQIGHPKVPAFFLVSGLRANSMALEFQRSGGAAATIALIGQGEARHATSQAGTPSTRPFARFNQFQASVKRDGSPLGNVTAASLASARLRARTRGRSRALGPASTSGARMRRGSIPTYRSSASRLGEDVASTKSGRAVTSI